MCVCCLCSQWNQTGNDDTPSTHHRFPQYITAHYYSHSSVIMNLIAPTREIAAQIVDVVRTVGTHMENLIVSLFIGGLPTEEDMLHVNCHVAVGTPGRLRALIESRSLVTDTMRMLVLDEADRLLELGFSKDMKLLLHFHSSYGIGHVEVSE